MVKNWGFQCGKKLAIDLTGRSATSERVELNRCLFLHVVKRQLMEASRGLPAGAILSVVLVLDPSII